MRRFILCFFLAATGAMGYPQTPRSDSQIPRYQSRVASRAEFDRLARTSYEGRLVALPHAMFVIDRSVPAGEERRIYYVNSNRYSFHSEFLNANYLSLERGREFFRRNYLESNRRFILGTIAWRKSLGQFTFEFWEGDLATSEIIHETFIDLSRTFFAPLRFKPNSAGQEEAAARLRDLVATVPPSEIESPGNYQPLHLGTAVGVLRILDRLTDETILDRNEIVIFREPPLSLTPISGLVTTSFSTPLAHVNLLARGWGIPNAYLKDAATLYQSLSGKFVYFETRPDGYTLRPALSEETQAYARRLAERSDLLTPEADLEEKSLRELRHQRRSDARRFGAKSANLGEIVHASLKRRIDGITVPRGFTVPFFYYLQFLTENGLEEPILEMLGNDRFNHDPAYRQRRLAELRARIQRGRLNAEFSRMVTRKKRMLFGDRGVFVRSSTNSEDLPNFSGAGLYATVPNVRDDRALREAIKTVWASLWNYQAYEARESFGINHAAVYPAVLIQEGMNAQAAGVMITTNPFDQEEPRTIYFNAKRGLGIRVVEGRRIPEQLMYDPGNGAIRVLTRSDDDTMLVFDRQGGVKPVTVETQRKVLTDDLVRRLARAARQIEIVFDDLPQDIEWLTIGRRIYIVQSRPYQEI